MESPADDALKSDKATRAPGQTVQRYLSGLSVTAPLISAIVKWDSDDVMDSTKRVLECTKSLIDLVAQERGDPKCDDDEVTELCIRTVSAVWSHAGTCEPKEWVGPIVELLARTTERGSKDKGSNHEFAGFSNVLCVLCAHGLQGRDCVTFHGVCQEVATLCDKSLAKLRVVVGLNPDHETALKKATHTAACELFTSTLEHEHKQYTADSYRASVDSSFTQSPFDMHVFMRRFNLYFEHLCEAIYINARQR